MCSTWHEPPASSGSFAAFEELPRHHCARARLACWCAVPAVSLDAADVRPRCDWDSQLERWVGVAVVVACVVLIFAVSNYGMFRWPPWHMGHGALFDNTTTNGGDMGAHVWWPWFMREHWFGRFRLAGWSPDWYAGFPVGQFYFPLPALLIDLFAIVMPSNVAFTLVTVSGSLLLPIAAYQFGRCLRFPWPAPPLFALVTLRYVFETRR